MKILQQLSFLEVEKMLHYSKKTAFEYGEECKSQKALGNLKAASDFEQYLKTWDRYVKALDDELKRKITSELEE